MAVRQLMLCGAHSVTYPYRVGPGLLETDLPRFIHEREFARAGVITNQTLAPLYGDALVAQIPGGFLIAIPDGEKYKTLDTVRDVYDQLLAQGAGRSTAIIALGGGVVGDVAGFAAASFMRGLPLIQAPTTLLAMVDSSIGGKTGVDLPQGKNLVGAFYDPLAVFADTAALTTLPFAEFRAGLAEVVKAALIADASLLDHLEQHGPEPVEEIIVRAAMVKAKIIAEDPLEQGSRAFLNLGHTFGHALEQASSYTIRHGEGVAIGLVAAARLSAQQRLCDPSVVDRIECLLIRLGLPVRYRDLAPQAVWEAMRHDKKWRNGMARFVLLNAVSEVTLVDNVPQSAVQAVLEDLREDT